MHKKNISFIIFSNGMGGAEQVVLQLIKNIDKTKFNVFLIINQEMIVYFKDFLDERNLLNIGNLYSFSNITFFNRLINKIGRSIDLQKKIVNNQLNKMTNFINMNNIEILHSHLMFDLYAGQLIKTKIKSIKFIYTVHGFLNLDNNVKIKYAITHKEFVNYLQKADYITCVSNLLKQKVIEILPEVKDRCIFISNALDKSELENVKKIKRMNDKIELLFMGGEKEVKGGLLLIQSIENLIENFDIKNFNLTILGPLSKNSSFYNLLINNQKIKEFINIVGFVKSPNHLDYIQSADVLIMPSKSEGMPIVLYEGMKLESALLVSKIPIFEDLLEDNVSAIIFDQNIESLTKSIKEIILDKKLRENIINYNNNQTIPYWINVIKEYESIYLIKTGNENE
jgi:glycosyltransferase involved in cell wall biosynthesis